MFNTRLCKNIIFLIVFRNANHLNTSFFFVFQHFHIKHAMHQDVTVITSISHTLDKIQLIFRK